MIDKKRQLQSAQKRFNDISYIHYTSNLMQLSQILLKRVSTEYFCDTVWTKLLLKSKFKKQWLVQNTSRQSERLWWECFSAFENKYEYIVMTSLLRSKLWDGKLQSPAKNSVIPPNFLVWKFCGKAQFLHSFRRIAQNCGETAFQQNFHTKKLGEITEFLVVHVTLKVFVKTSLKNKKEPLLKGDHNLSVMEKAVRNGCDKVIMIFAR